MKNVALTNYCAISLLQPVCQAAVFSSSAGWQTKDMDFPRGATSVMTAVFAAKLFRATIAAVLFSLRGSNKTPCSASAMPRRRAGFNGRSETFGPDLLQGFPSCYDGSDFAIVVRFRTPSSNGGLIRLTVRCARLRLFTRLFCYLLYCCQSLKRLAHAQNHLSVTGTDHRLCLSARLDGTLPPIVARSLHGIGLPIFAA